MLTNSNQEQEEIIKEIEKNEKITNQLKNQKILKIIYIKNKIINWEFIFNKLANFLANPGNFWQNQPIHIKRRLQKFEFPDGVILYENNFQTPNICSLFKLKSVIVGNSSQLVHYLDISIKHLKSTNNSPLRIEEDILLWENIQSELEVLDEILQTSE